MTLTSLAQVVNQPPSPEIDHEDQREDEAEMLPDSMQHGISPLFDLSQASRLMVANLTCEKLAQDRYWPLVMLFGRYVLRFRIHQPYLAASASEKPVLPGYIELNAFPGLPAL